MIMNAELELVWEVVVGFISACRPTSQAETEEHYEIRQDNLFPFTVRSRSASHCTAALNIASEML
jgi:hypothetical protein